MIINQSVGFTFIHIPKSAGTSVTQFLSPLNGPLDLEIGGTPFGEAIQAAYARRHRLRKHSKFAEMRSIIEMARPTEKMFVFAFVRNPYARLSSIFSFLRKWEDYDADLLSVMKGFSDFREFVASGIFAERNGPDDMFRPQCEWLKLDGQIAENVHWFRIEEVNSALRIIRSELTARGVPERQLPENFPHANRSQSETAAISTLSGELIESVRNYYAEDFNIFGYSQ